MPLTVDDETSGLPPNIETNKNKFFHKFELIQIIIIPGENFVPDVLLCRSCQ